MMRWPAAPRLRPIVYECVVCRRVPQLCGTGPSVARVLSALVLALPAQPSTTGFTPGLAHTRPHQSTLLRISRVCAQL